MHLWNASCSYEQKSRDLPERLGAHLCLAILHIWAHLDTVRDFISDRRLQFLCNNNLISNSVVQVRRQCRCTTHKAQATPVEDT